MLTYSELCQRGKAKAINQHQFCQERLDYKMLAQLIPSSIVSRGERRERFRAVGIQVPFELWGAAWS